MKAVVIGYGSIGARHARVLADLGCATAVLSARAVDHPTVFHGLAHALEGHTPEYVVIANATAAHGDTLRELIALGFGGRVLVEKPLFRYVETVPSMPFAAVHIAYNLRFHPIIRRLAEMLACERVLSVQCYVGQYLPEWRPGTDYRQSYSASAAQGGGVLRDLSHELDYLAHLLGNWRRVSALGGHFSMLEGDSDDVFALLMQTERCPIVQVQMNYLDRVGRRWLLVNTDAGTIAVDLVAGTLTKGSDVEQFAVARDDSYRAMHAAALAGEEGVLCTLSEGMETMRLIAAAEQSSNTGTWSEARP
ncbi:MAG: Gfo/Idh/MocA family protein [Sphingomonas sp.]